MMDNFDEILYRIIRRNRRVIIPDIGAFINNSSDESIVFSPLLKHNDGSLEEEMAEEGIANPADFLKEFAETVISVIDNGQRYHIAGLGYFFREGDIRFTFEEDRNAVTQKHSGETEIVYLPQQKERRSGILTGAIYLCLTAFACLLFVVFDICKSKDRLEPLTSITKKPVNQFVIIDKSDSLDETDDETNILRLSSSRTKSYHVVVACFEDKINAENFVLQCRQTGYDNAEILSVTGVLYPVSIGGFASQNEALETKLKYDSIFEENSFIYKTK
jgi:hypothetical protein